MFSDFRKKTLKATPALPINFFLGPKGVEKFIGLYVFGFFAGWDLG
jgi:hypothetical protein